MTTGQAIKSNKQAAYLKKYKGYKIVIFPTRNGWDYDVFQRNSSILVGRIKDKTKSPEQAVTFIQELVDKYESNHK
jgi:hypothetical protein